ncbi:MAG: hypothetical protein KAJ42_08965 [Gemmatimonadetes bacterium]|nr:hypothetical protein [Gemmatimonadota bacterium]
MAREDVYNGVVGSFSMYGGLLKDVADAIGMESALALHAKQGVHFGAQVAGAIQARLGGGELNIEAVTEVISGLTEGFGMNPEVEMTPTSVAFTHANCPIYDGLKMAGWEHDDIEAACNCMAGAEVEEITKAFPRLSGGLVFRATAEDPCVEGFSLDA